MLEARDEQLASKFRVEIIVPGLRLLNEQNPQVGKANLLGARRVFWLLNLS